jgi:hypothetical protein
MCLIYYTSMPLIIPVSKILFPHYRCCFRFTLVAFVSLLLLSFHFCCFRFTFVAFVSQGPHPLTSRCQTRFGITTEYSLNVCVRRV